MKFGVICPDRGDRPLFLEQFHRMLARQTVQPDILEIVDYAPKSDAVDITERYRFGYDRLRGKGLDCVLFMESDDWYRLDYIETMLKAWNGSDIFGTNYTTYYHLRIGKSFTFKHKSRSSMMSTLMKADLDVSWPMDNYAYTDMFLWMKSKSRETFFPNRGHICLGIKHGVGKQGGEFHSTKLKMFKDKGLDFQKTVGEDYAFYNDNFPILQTKKVGREVIFV